MKMADGHLKECYSTKAQHQCVCDAEQPEEIPLPHEEPF